MVQEVVGSIPISHPIFPFPTPARGPSGGGPLDAQAFEVAKDYKKYHETMEEDPEEPWSSETYPGLCGEGRGGPGGPGSTGGPRSPYLGGKRLLGGRGQEEALETATVNRKGDR